MLKKSLLAFIGIEFIHYCYLIYKLNYSKRIKNKITDKNIKEVLSSNITKSYLKINNHSNSFNLMDWINKYLLLILYVLLILIIIALLFIPS